MSENVHIPQLYKMHEKIDVAIIIKGSVAFCGKLGIWVTSYEQKIN